MDPSTDVREALDGPAALAARLLGVTYLLLIVGASVRVNGAGLACPDWPLCFGQVIPKMDMGVAFEFGHRVLAGLISLGYFGLMAWIFKAREAAGRGLLLMTVVGLVVLTIQVILGGLTVLELLAEWTVASHLLAGNTFCCMVLLVNLELRERMRPRVRATVTVFIRMMAGTLAISVPTQLVIGGFVSSSFAGLVCGTWPGCNGPVWFPTFSGLIGLQLTHRIAAYVLLVLATVMVGVSWGKGRVFSAALTLGVVVWVQATLGILNVLMRLPVEVTLAHTGGAAAAMLAMTWLNYEVWMAPLSQTLPAASSKFATGDAS
ncbi:MAG: hypothetical protein GWP91_20540 [Rhodobacterales bacterium]|nr:hypothetical protein [Rhodobacterales bacterium]